MQKGFENGVGNRSSAWVDANNLTLGENQWTPLILNNSRGTECKCMAKSAVNCNVELAVSSVPRSQDERLIAPHAAS